jgi:hypothetical protein
VQVDNLLLVRGKVDADGSDPKVLVDHIELLALEEMDIIPQDALLDLPGDVDLLPMPDLDGFDEEAEPDFDHDETPKAPIRVTPVCHVPPQEEALEAPEPVHYNAPKTTHPSQPAPHRISEPDDPFGDGPPIPDDWVIAPRPVRRETPPPAEMAAPQSQPEESPSTPAPSPAASQPAPTQPEETVMPAPAAERELKLPPYLVPPSGPAAGLGLDLMLEKKSEKPRMVTAVLHTSGDKRRDHRRLQRLYGLLRSCPGKDRFSLMIHEGGHNFLVEFPNNTTGITTELLRKVSELIGEENVRVTPINVH